MKIGSSRSRDAYADEAEATGCVAKERDLAIGVFDGDLFERKNLKGR